MENFYISQNLINPQAIEVCRILSEAGYQAFIVGGCVRDLLLGVKPKDWDITSSAIPEKIIELFPKTYPTGLQHGTVTVSMGEGIENHFEVTTFRVEGDYKDGRRPEEVFFVMNVEQDLGRRDLTINAIAYDPLNNRLIDPFDGIHDLQHQVIRAVGLPEARFQEDGLRIMRVARFAARFGYQVDVETLNGMKASLETLKKVSKERIKDELCKTLMTKQPALGLKLLKECRALAIACPFLTSKPPYLYFATHQNKCQGDLETRLAFLYANCQSPQVQEELISLKFSNKELKRILFLLELLDKIDEFLKRDTLVAYRSFMAHLKNLTPDSWQYTLEQFIYLTEAIGWSSKVLFAKYENEIVFSKKELQIDGFDLINIGMKPGPEIKSILDKCYLDILQYPEHNTKEYLFKFVLGM